ncbi:DUF4942 domain-containing protein [Leptospira langatensis]|uniref:DUF4942 domain-containing protein n=1 Tax=Leptospira langatensis TaxID=2484983 RepID=A0A5R2ASX5_9LEPT|nr:DUF4942 domain-containing protein [Leptospira langatensis]TGJ99813.1 DUF4942 domain-containing protein [Leptospira langatensis]
MRETSNEIAKKLTLEEIISIRDQTLTAFNNAVDEILKAQKLQERLRIYPFSAEIARVGVDDRNAKEQIRKEHDRHVWRYVAENCGLFSLMDRKAKESFDKELQNDVPPVSAENLASTFARLEEEKENIFERGVVNVFRELSGNFVSNDRFRIGKKIILNGGFYWGAGDKIMDIERIFYVLDRKKPPEYHQSARRHMEAARYRNVREFSDDYFKIISYKNGNHHISFKREDLVERVNGIIARACGPVVGERTKSKRWKQAV